MLPRVKEVLERAEKARFYKERIYRNRVEALLQRQLDDFDRARFKSSQRLTDEISQTQQLAISLRDEETALMESDAKMLEAVVRKIEVYQRRSVGESFKCKSEKARVEFEQKLSSWRQQDEASDAPSWRLEPPARQPRIRLDMRLLWPGQKEIGYYRQIYRQLVRRPESRLGDKRVQALRDRYRHGGPDQPDDAEDLASHVQVWAPFAGAAKSGGVAPQLETSEETRQRLGRCKQLRRLRLRRLRQHRQEALPPPLPDADEESGAEEGGEGPVGLKAFRGVAEAAAAGAAEVAPSSALSRQKSDATRATAAAWPDQRVVSCRYIRGYEPPEDLLPTEGQELVDFVFGN